MSEQVPNQGNGGNGGNQGDSRTERIAHNPAVARVPERVARGTLATGVLVFTGQQEFVLDFLQVLAKPAQLVARVVVTPAMMDRLVGVLRENFGRFSSTFGAPPSLPKPVQERPMSAQEIYGDIKIADDMLSGMYANNVMVGHTPAEFSLDFITSFYPHAAVSARVYMAANRIPGLIDTLNTALGNYVRAQQQAQQQMQQPQQPPQPPRGPEGGGSQFPHLGNPSPEK